MICLTNSKNETTTTTAPRNFKCENGVCSIVSDDRLAPEERDSVLLGNANIVLSIDQYDATTAEAAVRILKTYGVLLAKCNFEDPKGVVFQRLVTDIGNPDGHDKDGKQVWDIKFNPAVNQQTGTRSLTLREFEMHTDACFDSPTPKYIGMYVVHEDALGGGLSQIIDGRKLLARLSDKTKRVLRTKYTVRVPEEFFKGKEHVQVAILDCLGNFRIRREIIVRELCTAEQLKALEELEALLNHDQLVETMFLKTGWMLILDNGKFLHARTAVKDQNRHLLRMRFQAKPEAFFAEKS